MWILVLVILFLVLKSMSRHATKGTIGTETRYISTACGGGVGDSFTGNTTVAGVNEPAIHCLAVRGGIFSSVPPMPGPLPHAFFPVDPPPIAIQRPIMRSGPSSSTRGGCYPGACSQLRYAITGGNIMNPGDPGGVPMFGTIPSCTSNE
jgi:hypothetical protein